MDSSRLGISIMIYDSTIRVKFKSIAKTFDSTILNALQICPRFMEPFSCPQYLLLFHFTDVDYIDWSINISLIFHFTWERSLTKEKSLKIPKGQTKSVYRRRTDNTMAKNKMYKRTNNDLQIMHIKLRIE